ncbi:hypothetical protein [Devosia neptuniae]|uniref:hypothetical protein n=1 Tax=Devosia neptuniae TaxID=191302 RepID=UPI0022AF63E5|nr:hypothetical protein [Devosia neptuniae]MCZ4347011.1 hypothetical protein [Devosia neptuniae]
MADLVVTLVANRITGSNDAATGRGVGQGSVDAIWLSGENFFTLKQQDLLLGSFAQAIPNAVNFEFDAADPRAALNLDDFSC